jgi:hypothetical protein
MWSACCTVVSGGRMMSAAVAGAVALVCSDMSFYLYLLPVLSPGSGARRRS